MAARSFDTFLKAFPPDRVCSVDAIGLGSEIRSRFSVQVPDKLVDFWGKVGCGSFADHELYFFGLGLAGETRDGLVAWNSDRLWLKLFPAPADGGPLYFAETCFGDQIGFRYDNGECLAVILSLATMESFVMTRNFDDLFEEVFTDRYAFTDPEHLAAARQGAGPLGDGQWYCPVVSPLVGGSAAPDNFIVMTPKVYFATAVAEWEALRGAT